MRQRRLKNIDIRENNVKELMADEPKNLKGAWHQFFANRNNSKLGTPIYLEIGCGKGNFITELAKRNPQNNYIALEGQKSVIIMAMEKVKKLGLDNIIFLSEYMLDICDYFAPNELDGLYLNFSDPWPKSRHAKRRLTYRQFLQKYKKIIRPNGFIEFKTDNDTLYDFSINEIDFLGYNITEQTRDLHNSKYIQKNIMTEYEEKFSNRGQNINYVRVDFGGEDMILAQANGRKMPKEDKAFALNNRAKEMIAEGKEGVINATLGALLTDDGNLAVIETVANEINKLNPQEILEYAPIGGLPAYKEAVKKEIFLDYETKACVEVIATPGGTGAIRNTISNYSKPGDSIITCDWYWGPYNTLCQEQGRKLETYKLFNDERKFNIRGFKDKIYEVAKRQETLVILLNTPAHNPTGYSINDDEWDQIIDILNSDVLEEVPTALFIDIAYIDFAGDPKEVRKFLPKLDKLKANVLPIIGYSTSKTFTAYGTRTGAMMCLAKTQEIADEFKQVCEFSARNTWSNCNKTGQKLIADISQDKKLYDAVMAERKVFRDMLLRRGEVFENEANAKGLDIVPFNSGFFACIKCDNATEISDKLAEEGIFVLPLQKGLRVSIASISEEKCRIVVDKIAEILK